MPLPTGGRKVEHKQRRGDRKDAVAESLESTRQHPRDAAQGATAVPPVASDSANLLKLAPTGVKTSDSSDLPLRRAETSAC